MDSLTDGFGQLSTKAKEWKPALNGGRSSSQNSSVNYPLSPIQSPIRTSGLRPSPPGRTAWQQGGTGTPNSSNDWTAQGSSIYGDRQSSHSWGDTQPPAWPDVSSQDQPQNYPDLSSQNWQDSGPVSIPAGPPPPPVIRSLHSMPDELWRYYRDVAFESQREMDVSDPRYKAVPPAFTSAYPLDAGKRSSFGYPISIFKVVSREDGHLYCLRRADNVRISHKICSTVSDRWNNALTLSRRLVSDHPGLVRFYRCFLANRAVYFVHQYCPGARTLKERFFDPHNAPIPLPEPVLWSLITQLVAVIRHVHGGNLACRTLQLNHILCHGHMDGRIRLRVNCLGVVDVLEFEGRKQPMDLQREDLADLGRLILSLGTGTEITRTSDAAIVHQCNLYAMQHMSVELRNLVMQLLSSDPPSIFAVTLAIASHVMDELDLQQTTLDQTEMALSSEFESSRALRLLLKMGYVNERPELGMNRRWTESGDCYVLKLFRDYVFHQADENGNPIMDLGHVISSLNKLDAAEEEQIVLASRDGKTLMVVSFGDVARSLEKAYTELCMASTSTTGGGGVQHYM